VYEQFEAEMDKFLLFGLDKYKLGKVPTGGKSKSKGGAVAVTVDKDSTFMT